MISNGGVLKAGMKGLKRLEYRGYDSAGLAVDTGGEIQCIRSVGKVDSLDKKIGDLDGETVILHSRWATHGGVTETNAHPHSDCKNNIYVVHNGIIENYREIKKNLEDKGHKFFSDTDTEVLPHLIEHFFKGNLEDAVREALKLIKGTYGLAVIAKDDPGKIVAARMFSPLVISVNDSGGFVASDPSAVVAHSKRMIFLEDGEVAVVKKDDFTITDLDNHTKNRKETELDWDIEGAQKGGHPHFMIKEIMEQPETVANSIRGRLIPEEGTAKLGGIEAVKERLDKVKKINIIACGTSYYSGLIGEYLIEEIAGISVEVDLASEFRYRKPVISDDEAYLFISQSGETADSLGALREIKRKGALTLGIVNVVGSSLARETDAGIYNHAGPEIGVASTKAFTSQVVILSLLALFLGRRKELSLQEGKKMVDDILALPELIKDILSRSSEIKVLAEKYKDFPNMIFMGRKYNYPVALEGALKLKETSYIHAEGLSAGEMKHGPIAMIDENLPTVAICLFDSVREKMISNIQEIKARKGPLLILASDGDEEINDMAEDLIRVPRIGEAFSPILSVIPLQIFAYYVSVARGIDPDKPRNLAKSVTVE